MSSRKPIVGGNWKMNTDLASAVELAGDVVASCRVHVDSCEVIVCPPFPYLHAVGRALGNNGIQLGAQDVWHQPDGAFTGEVSLNMLTDLGVSWVIVGHSERRHVIGECDELINLKLRAVLESGLRAILCVGETMEQRQAGDTTRTNIHQLMSGLRHVPAGTLDRLVIAYEPVWAIGTGMTATPGDAEHVHHIIRTSLGDLYDESLADSVRIQYGGSVKPNNARDLFSQPNIDGGLIGGASLSADDFRAIVQAAAETSGSAH